MRYTVTQFETLGGLKCGVVDCVSGGCAAVFARRSSAEKAAMEMDARCLAERSVEIY